MSEFLFDELQKKEKVKKVKKLSDPFKMELYFREQSEENSLALKFAEKPTVKHLSKWKLFIQKNGIEDSHKIIKYVCGNFKMISAKYKLFSLNADVFYGFSDTFNYLRQNGLKENFDSSNRGSNEYTQTESIGW